jgi:hypothetical protein
MEDTYQDNAYQDEYYYEPEPKKGMSGWVIALIVILAILVVCCVCACMAAVLLGLTGPAVGNVFSGIVETMEAPMP